VAAGVPDHRTRGHVTPARHLARQPCLPHEVGVPVVMAVRSTDYLVTGGRRSGLEGA
jgi:hypothetical protein